MNSFVDSHNDSACAEDIFNALHYGREMQNSKTGVLEIDLSNSNLCGPSISTFHSEQFFENHMNLYRYFNAGKGKTVNYSCNLAFQASYNVKKCFSSTKKLKKISIFKITAVLCWTNL